MIVLWPHRVGCRAGEIYLYAYVNGDPLGYVDPDGQQSIPIPCVPDRSLENYYPKEVTDGIEKIERESNRKYVIWLVHLSSLKIFMCDCWCIQQVCQRSFVWEVNWKKLL